MKTMEQRPETREHGVSHEVSRSESQPRARWTLRHRCILGAALAIEVLVFSTVSFAIAYAISNAAIRQAGEDLAASMVDTVTARIGTYVNLSEVLLLDVVRTARLPGYQLPSDDPDAPGGWSLKWTLALRARMATTQFRINTVSVIFDDGGVTAVGRWWNNNSWIYTMAAAHDVPLPPVSCNNCSDLQWSIEVRRDERPVMNVSRVDLFHRNTFASWNPKSNGVGWQPLLLRDARAAKYFFFVRSFGRTAWCSWTRPGFRTFQMPGEFFFAAVCGVINASNTFLGLATVERTLGDLQNFLDDTATTPNTAMFIIDNFGYLVASTLGVPFVKILAPNESLPTDASYSCLNSSDASPYTPQRVGCHQHFADYPYPPLQDIPMHVILTSHTVKQYGRLAGANYYYVTNRISSQFMPGYAMNLVLLLPEKDVVGDVSERLVFSIVICFSLCIVGTVFANLLVHWLARSPGLGSAESCKTPPHSITSPYFPHTPVSDPLRGVHTMSTAYIDVLMAVRRLANTSSGPVANSLTLLVAADKEIGPGNATHVVDTVRRQ